MRNQFIALSILLSLTAAAAVIASCKVDEHNDSDTIQRRQEEAMLQEATVEVGMPAITNFRERRILKAIFEMRDKEISTYTYLTATDGRLVFFCNSVGFPIPYATEYTSPQKPAYNEHGNFVMPQADPNGLFPPADAEGTYVMCKNPNGKDVSAVYAEPRLITAPFPLDSASPTATSTSTATKGQPE